jgi:hypothetical protein
MLFPEVGTHILRYRAVDNAGNYSDWRSVEFTVYPPESESSIITDASINGGARFASTNARNGAVLLRDTAMLHDALENLPAYVMGADYLVWQTEDVQRNEEADIRREAGIRREACIRREAYVRFQVTCDAVVYVFTPEGEERPEGFSFVENSRSVNRANYGGNGSFSMKRFAKGAWVSITVAVDSALPPFIAAQRTGSVFAEIRVRPEEPDGAANPFNEYEAGTAVVLGCETSPWYWSRRLPLHRRWFVSTGEGWQLLEENRFTLPEETESVHGYVRFRLELYTPDGQIEYRTEKEIRVIEKQEEDEE